MENHEIIIEPVFSESAYALIIDPNQNKIGFHVSKKANKQQIKLAVQELYNVRVTKVNTHISPDGDKRAIVTLAKEYEAVDLATDLNLF